MALWGHGAKWRFFYGTICPAKTRDSNGDLLNCLLYMLDACFIHHNRDFTLAKVGQRSLSRMFVETVS